MEVKEENNNPINTQEVKSQKELIFRFINFIRENLTLFILVPTVLGGLWQVISLLNVGIPYLRFFSITQLISDGLILMLMIPLFLMFPITAIFLGNLFKRIINDSSSKWHTSTIALTIITLLLIGYQFYIIDIGFEMFLNRRSLLKSVNYEVGIFMFFIPTVMILAAVQKKLIKRFKLYSSNILSKSIGKAQKILKTILVKVLQFWFDFWSILIMLSGSTWMVITFNIFSSLGDYYMPLNLINTEMIYKTIKQNYNLNPQEFKVSYLNDTYIFIEYNTLDKKEIDSLNKASRSIPMNVIILKTDILFQNTTK